MHLVLVVIAIGCARTPPPPARQAPPPTHERCDLTGRVLGVDGTPAANIPVRSRTTTIAGKVVASSVATTRADGTFRLTADFGMWVGTTLATPSSEVILMECSPGPFELRLEQ